MYSKNLESLFDLLNHADDDVENNRIAPIEDTFNDLRDLLTDR